MLEETGSNKLLTVGRYCIHAEIAHGGMATVHLGRLMGPVGFSRTVAIKRLHAGFAKDPEFVAMFMDEARLAARVQHPNVVSIIDVVAEQGELMLVMEYVQGESLSRLLRASRDQNERVAPKIAVKIMIDLLSGLHAAHEARNERGQSLGLVHRDVSPQNIMVGMDGVARLIDFGVAKAAGRFQHTRGGVVKGKLAYMAPEQIKNDQIDRRADVYAAASVLWQTLVGRSLFTGDEANLIYAALTAPAPPPSTVNPELSAELDAIVLTGLQKNPAKRYATALEMADALEGALAPASAREVARWMERLAGKTLTERAKVVAEVESMSHVTVPPTALLAADGTGSAPGGSGPSAVAGLEVAGAGSGKPTSTTKTGAGDVASSAPHQGPANVEVELSTETSSTINTGSDVLPVRRLSGKQATIVVGLALGAVGILLLAMRMLAPKRVEATRIDNDVPVLLSAQASTEPQPAVSFSPEAPAPSSSLPAAESSSAPLAPPRASARKVPTGSPARWPAPAAGATADNPNKRLYTRD